MNKKYNTILFLLMLVLISSNVSAQLKSDSWLWTLNLGFTSAESEATGNKLNGYSFNSTIENVKNNL